MLDDLGAGIPINESLPTRTKMTLDQLDKDFAQFARERAEAVAPGRPGRSPSFRPRPIRRRSETGWRSIPRASGDWRRLASRLVAEEKWAEAKEALEKIKALYPEYVGPENAYMLLAAVHRRSVRPGRRAQVSRNWRRATATRARLFCG